jgi:hypothetical protein
MRLRRLIVDANAGIRDELLELVIWSERGALAVGPGRA